MTNRIGRIYGLGLWALDENGMEAVPALAPGEPAPDVKLRLRELADAWRDARRRQRLSLTTTLDLGESFKHKIAHCHRRDAERVEWDAARLALIHAGVMLPDEDRPPWTFAPVVVAFGPGQTVHVESRGRCAPSVRFEPAEPALLTESLS